MLMRKETKLKRWIRKEWDKEDWWSEAYEPSMGSGVGYADLQLRVNQLVPVELKLCEVENGYIVSDDIRPDQIGWHTRLNIVGQKTFFIWGVCTHATLIPKRLFIGNVKQAITLKQSKQLLGYLHEMTINKDFAKSLFQYIETH